jgi:hypothetical protein
LSFVSNLLCARNLAIFVWIWQHLSLGVGFPFFLQKGPISVRIEWPHIKQRQKHQASLLFPQ